MGREHPRETLIMAFTTLIINLKRLEQVTEARESIRIARGLIERYPHLRSAGVRLDDLESEL